MILCLKKTTHQNGRLANFNDVQHLSDYKYKALIVIIKILKSHIKLI